MKRPMNCLKSLVIGKLPSEPAQRSEFTENPFHGSRPPLCRKSRIFGMLPAGGARQSKLPQTPFYRHFVMQAKLLNDVSAPMQSCLPAPLYGVLSVTQALGDRCHAMLHFSCGSEAKRAPAKCSIQPFPITA